MTNLGSDGSRNKPKPLKMPPWVMKLFHLPCPTRGNAIEKTWPVGTRGAIGLLRLIWIVYGSFQCAAFVESSISERARRLIAPL